MAPDLEDPEFGPFRLDRPAGQAGLDTLRQVARLQFCECEAPGIDMLSGSIEVVGGGQRSGNCRAAWCMACASILPARR